MVHLPDEILDEIAAYLQDRTACGNYRLVNKRFAEIGATHLFDVFPCKATMDTLERTRSIINSTNPKLKGYVKVLDYQGRREDDYTNPTQEGPEFTFIREVLKGFIAASPITGFRAVELMHDLVVPENFDASFRETCINLTRVDIHMYCPRTSYGVSACPIHENDRTLHDFLIGLRKLKTLEIGFKGRAFPERHKVSSIIPSQQPWPLLQNIHLEYIVITPDDAFALLKNHETTLRCFHLNGIFVSRFNKTTISNVEGWRRVFKQMENVKHLQHGALNRTLFEWDHNFRYTIQVGGRSVEINTNMAKDIGLDVEERSVAKITSSKEEWQFTVTS